MEIKLDNVTNLLKVLTWKKIIQATVFLLICGTAYGFWENRITIYNSLRVGVRVESNEPVRLEVSAGTRNSIEYTLAKTRNFFAGIELINVDFKKNSSFIAYSSYSNDEFKKIVDDYNSIQIAPIPLFTNREVTNQKIIDLINGDFICHPFSETIQSSVMPKAGNIIDTVCSISIPPYYGRFSGYMNIYLTKKPDANDLIFIKQAARDLSIRIYEYDIARKDR